MEMMIGIWAIVICVIGLNGFSAGVAAVLHLWKPKQSAGGKVLFSAMLAGGLPASLVIPNMVIMQRVPPPYLIGVVIVFAAVMAVSLPGAVLVTRKLEASRGEYRTFE